MIIIVILPPLVHAVHSPHQSSQLWNKTRSFFFLWYTSVFYIGMTWCRLLKGGNCLNTFPPDKTSAWLNVLLDTASHLRACYLFPPITLMRDITSIMFSFPHNLSSSSLPQPTHSVLYIFFSLVTTSAPLVRNVRNVQEQSLSLPQPFYLVLHIFSWHNLSSPVLQAFPVKDIQELPLSFRNVAYQCWMTQNVS